jgi:hypothetical protein
MNKDILLVPTLLRCNPYVSLICIPTQEHGNESIFLHLLICVYLCESVVKKEKIINPVWKDAAQTGLHAPLAGTADR